MSDSGTDRPSSIDPGRGSGCPPKARAARSNPVGSADLRTGRSAGARRDAGHARRKRSSPPSTFQIARDRRGRRPLASACHGVPHARSAGRRTARGWPQSRRASGRHFGTAAVRTGMGVRSRVSRQPRHGRARIAATRRALGGGFVNRDCGSVRPAAAGNDNGAATVEVTAPLDRAAEGGKATTGIRYANRTVRAVRHGTSNAMSRARRWRPVAAPLPRVEAAPGPRDAGNPALSG